MLLLPPPTVAPYPETVLPKPPATVALLPEAVLFRPPPAVPRSPEAVLSSPPPTAALLPEAVGADVGPGQERDGQHQAESADAEAADREEFGVHAAMPELAGDGFGRHEAPNLAAQEVGAPRGWNVGPGQAHPGLVDECRRLQSVPDLLVGHETAGHPV